MKALQSQVGAAFQTPTRHQGHENRLCSYLDELRQWLVSIGQCAKSDHLGFSAKPIRKAFLEEEASSPFRLPDEPYGSLLHVRHPVVGERADEPELVAAVEKRTAVGLRVNHLIGCASSHW
jgi:hypothetical protein